MQHTTIDTIREQFPILKRAVYNKQLVYFDNAATTQKPQSVIDEIVKYYTFDNSNIHRGVHFLSQYATEKHEYCRQKIADFINADKSEEIIFTRGTTEAINLVASSFGQRFLSAGDEVLLTTLEHHSNIVPWQLICEQKGAIIKVLPISIAGELEVDKLSEMISERTKIVSVAHVSNALGTVNPVKDIIKIAHEHNVPVLVDGAQAISHIKVDVKDLGCDFYCFSGHKMYGPMGIGVLYGKEKYLEAMPPYQGGGEMIKTVSFENTVFNDLPFKFEAGTPNVGDAIAFERALSFMENVGYEFIAHHERALLEYCTRKMQELGFVKIIGNAPDKAGVISFLLDGIHPYDVGIILDKLGVAIRTGHHCAEPVMQFYGISGTARASFAVYNTKEEVDILVEGLKTANKMLS
ncbi:MAG: cysteine desulfurase [Bacteroidales bacterium]|nr:cysteine desulfurase [Bacteroidales bacterium]MDD3151605.1 cysteine desulfurase [Bacteroidales bacterium]